MAAPAAAPPPTPIAVPLAVLLMPHPDKINAPHNTKTDKNFKFFIPVNLILVI
jgi:hypothetical protein